MNFDDTHIVIRERGFAEVMDLALKVVSQHAGPLVMAGLTGVLPWAVLNGLLLNPMVHELDIWDESPGFVTFMVLLVAVETPLATALVTLYLGQATFMQAIDVRRLLRDFVGSLPQLLWHTFTRAVLAITFIGIALPYAFWPFQAELILLERNPMMGGRQKRMTTRRRSRNLHKASGGDLFGHWLAATAAGVLLVLALVGGLSAAVSQLAGYDLTRRGVLLYLFPACLWATVCFFAVVRFLAYLDLRIRREGWEVELKMRSEGARLDRGLA